MFFHGVVVVLSLLSFQRGFHVSSCVPGCEDKPVFIPSKLVVKYNDPTSAQCVGCKKLCLNRTVDLEKSLGTKTRNGTTINWDVDKMTEWDISPTCFYIFNDDDDQCCTKLAVTVYQPPDNVSISLVGHSGPMFEGHQYTLGCMVQRVAPAEYLSVTFHKGQEPLGATQHTKNREKEKTPVTETFNLNITATKEDDGVKYWCQAMLELGQEGPRDKPVVASTTLISTVHYGPKTEQTSLSITLTAGDPLSLDCSAIGNPLPSYTWTLPSARPHPFNSSVLMIGSVALADGGQYVCVVSNERGNVIVKFSVAVHVNPLPFVIAAVVVTVVVIAIILSVVYFQHYKHNRTGEYKLRFRKKLRHVPVATQVD